MVFPPHASMAVGDPTPDPSGRPTLIAVSGPANWPSTLLATMAALLVVALRSDELSEKDAMGNDLSPSSQLATAALHEGRVG